MNTDVSSESTVEPVFESKLLKPCSDDGDCFTNSKVVSAVRHQGHWTSTGNAEGEAAKLAASALQEVEKWERVEGD